MTINLEDLRTQLDTVDKQIIELLEKRFAITDQVGIYKAQNNLPATDLKREQLVVQKLQAYAKHPILKETISEIYQQIFLTVRAAHRLKQNPISPFHSIGIIGLGLIGGSIIKTLKTKDPTITIATVKRDSTNNDLAKTQNYIDQEYKTLAELAQNVELIILASSIDSIPGIAEEIVDMCHAELDSASAIQIPNRVRDDKKLLVIDVASVKSKITKQFQEYSNETIEFIPTHPMSGSEKTGFAHSKATLFINKPWVITPHKNNNQATIIKIQQFISYLGSKPYTLAPEQHDRYAALISHLIFIISTYLFAYPFEMDADALKMSGSGFESMTRLASGSAPMHEQIVKNNYKHIKETLEQFIQFIKNNDITEENALEFFAKYKKERDLLLQEKS